MKYENAHKFHIPVLGIGYSIDTPLKVAKFGISSVISLVDDTILERLREHYLLEQNLEYVPIVENADDKRSKRITAYLNMINKMVSFQVNRLKQSPFEPGSDLNKYFEMLPENSEIKKRFQIMLESGDEVIKKQLKQELKDSIAPGSIDVNIMTKLDKANLDEKMEYLPNEFNDAHAALRGFAESDLESSIIFSAGMNPRLYSYLETFKDFFPDEKGKLRKKVVIKVSDFRSALIQGKFLAKKGIWVSEFRIESGLNCGGHAFATDGFLLGPILEEFNNRKEELLSTIKEIIIPALGKKNISVNGEDLVTDITVQGGVGNFAEQQFLLRKYNVKSVGWGSPFLLAPDVMNVDKRTLEQLSAAGENDLYLSEVSPLGVPFNNLRNSEKDVEKMERAEMGSPGSACPKKFLVSTKEYSEKPECTASITYLKKKMKDLKEKFPGVEDFSREYEKVINKSCLCVGLTASVTKTKDIDIPKQSLAVAVCPGPNLAYFSKITNLREMVDHIYGRINIITDSNRPNMFIKELKVYIDYLSDKIEKSITPLSSQTEQYFETFTKNILDGIEYYKKLIPELLEERESVREKFNLELKELEAKLQSIMFSYV